MTPGRARLWFLHPSQWWRWPHRRLWGSGTIDSNDLGSVLAYAMIHLPTTTRDAFLLHRMVGLTYPTIASHLTLDPRTVENYISLALIQIGETVDLVEQVRRCDRLHRSREPQAALEDPRPH